MNERGEIMKAETIAKDVEEQGTRRDPSTVGVEWRVWAVGGVDNENNNNNDKIPFLPSEVWTGT